jgi:hypothetical protein
MKGQQTLNNRHHRNPYDRNSRYHHPHNPDSRGNSALRAATRTNPRNLPCPECESPNRLTPKDVALGYICDRCADRAELGY